MSVALSADVLPPVRAEPNQLIVGSVLRLYSANTFLCKLRNHPLYPNAVFRVHVPSVVIEHDPNASIRAACFVSRLLSSAASIILYDVRPQSYFGLLARVLVDGKDLTEMLIEKKLGQAPPVPPPAAVAYPQKRSFESAPAVADRPLAPDAGQPKALSLSMMLNRRVNLGHITPQTTLKEALEYLAASQAPALPIVVLWKDLQVNCLLDPDTPVGADGLTDIPALVALKQILRSAAAGGPLPVIRIENNLLTIGSKQTFPEKGAAGIYQIDELVGPSQYEDSF